MALISRSRLIVFLLFGSLFSEALISKQTIHLPKYSCCSTSRSIQLISLSSELSASDNENLDDALVLPDYLITDSETYLGDRPTVFDLLLLQRNLVPFLLVVTGFLVAGCNVLGVYNSYYTHFQQLSIAFGFGSAALDLASISQPFEKDTTIGVSPNVRLGVVDDALLNAYSGTYTGGAAWLAWRTSAFCPKWLVSLDVILAPIAIAVFIFSIACPIVTLLNHYKGSVPWAQQCVTLVRGTEGAAHSKELPKLSETELLRARSLLGIGVVGCTYAPIAVTFLALGQEWWSRVLEVYPGQPTMESSTALYGVFATQASMLAHRSAKMGVARVTRIVPVFSLVCFILTILPCAAGIYWLGDSMSFFELYSL